MTTSPCIHCGAALTFEPIPGISIVPSVCVECDQRIEADNQAKAQKAAQTALADRWRAICPPIYQDTATSHPEWPKSKADKVMNWKYGAKGLVLHGKTRKCKTRIAWELIRLLIILEGRSVCAMTSGEFSRQCAAAHAAGDGAFPAWFKRITSCDVFFLDDLGKLKLTDRVESELFEVIEHLTNHGIPMIVTSNSVGVELIERMTPDRGPAIVARLREFCEPISFL